MAPDKLTSTERTELAERLFNATLKAAVAIMEKTPPAELKAATLTAARQFLADQGINMGSLGNGKSRLSREITEGMPSFPGDPAATEPPFKPVPPADGAAS